MAENTKKVKISKKDKDMNAYMDGRLVSRQLYAYNQQTAKEHGGSFVRRGTT